MEDIEGWKGEGVLNTFALPFSLTLQGGNFHLKVGGAKSSGNAGDPMLLRVAVIPW